MSDDLIARLRSERRLAAEQIDELIAEITRLRAENEKLRAAIFEKETVMQIRAAAAAALKETENEGI